MQGVSIIVCCYNSSWIIKDTLKYLAKQKIPSWIKCELIIVDNASTDGLSEIVKKEWAKNNSAIPLIIVNEKKLGLAWARRRGVYASKYEFIVFCDDDNWLDENYITNSFKLLNENESIGIAGGQNFGKLETEAPIWWSEKAQGYAVGRQGVESGDISERGYIWGAGMVVRRRLMIKLFDAGFKPLLSGRCGNILVSGDDSELCQWVLAMGYKLWYCENLTLEHFIKKERLSAEYATRLFNGHKETGRIKRWYAFFNANIELVSNKSHYLRLKSIFVILKKMCQTISIKQQIGYIQLIVGTRYRVHPILYDILSCYSKLTLTK